MTEALIQQRGYLYEIYFFVVFIILVAHKLNRVVRLYVLKHRGTIGEQLLSWIYGQNFEV
jgi:hypothetical protein